MVTNRSWWSPVWLRKWLFFPTKLIYTLWWSEKKFLCFQFSHQCRSSYGLVFQLFVSNEWFFFLLEHFFRQKKLAFENNIPVSVDFLCLCSHQNFFQEKSWKTEATNNNTIIRRHKNRNRRRNKKKTFDVYFLIFDVSPEKAVVKNL